MERRLLLLIVFTCALISSYAQDWGGVPVPADPGNGKVWQLQTSFSDDFNYTGKSGQFTGKWNDTYINGWSGPGLTEWINNHSWVADGNLIIRASRKPGTNKVYCGVVTSKTPVMYPVYTEARILVSNLELSSNFWMLSPDDRREIDMLEVYGGASQIWFAQHMSTNFHVFFRNPDNSIRSDYNDQTHNALPGNALWRNGWHRFGVYWKSPTDITFYIDGQQTSNGSWAQVIMIDKDYTGATLDKSIYNMDREMFLIIDTEDHKWRSDQGIVATDEDLADDTRNRMYVDWVRTYKPVDAGSGNSAPINSTIWLKANNGAGDYVVAEKFVANNPLEADRSAVGDWEKFLVEDAGGGLVALRANANGKYVSARIDESGNPIRAFQTYIGAWEKFTWESQGNGKVAFKASANGKYVQAQLHLPDAPLAAVGHSVQGWETFNWGTVAGSNARIADIRQPPDIAPTNEISIQVYPNPISGDRFSVHLDNPHEKAEITITDIQGRMLFQQETMESYLDFNRDIFPTPGVYMMNVKLDGSVRTIKMVSQ